MKKLASGLLILSLFCSGLAFNTKAAEIGETAPQFTAMSTMGEVSLAEFAENKYVVLAFFFAAFTPV